ncbi:hypothetical protein RYR53_003010 [Aeromonas hydrophila]|nr:hypothetical protein [Aeromonas hydrophila]
MENGNIIHLNLCNLNDLKTGDIINNKEEISFIYFQNDNFIIFEIDNKTHDISYYSKNLPYKTHARLNKIENLRNQIFHKFKGTNLRQTRNSYITCLQNSLIIENDDDFDLSLQDFSNHLNDDHQVSNVISSAENHVVWINNEGVCCYADYEVSDGVKDSLIEFNRLRNIANTELPKMYRPALERHLATAIAAAFRTLPREDISTIFLPAENYIFKVINSRVKISYLTSVCCSSIVLIYLLYILHLFKETIQIPILMGDSLPIVASGILGAFISTFERSKQLEITQKESSTLILFYGLFRVLFGAVFGFIAYLTVNSGIAFTNFKESLSALMLLGIAAGFSERLIPEFITSITDKN